MSAKCLGSGASSTQAFAASGARNRAAGTSLNSAALAELFPRDGADVVVGAQLKAFQVAVGSKAVTACMSAEGLPGPPHYSGPAPQFGTEQFPNFPVIERRLNVGVTVVPAPVDPAASMSSAEQKAYEARLTHCESTAAGGLTFLNGGQAEALMRAWMNIFFQTRASAPVTAANVRATSCSHGTPFPANSVQDEIETIEGKVTPLNGSQERTVMANGVHVLVRCFGAEQALMDRLMTAKRVHFFTEHAQAIDAIEQETNSAVEAAEARYGVRPRISS